MKKISLLMCLFVALVQALSNQAMAQEAVVANPDHEAMLASRDAKLAANKRLVYDYWREVIEAGHAELMPKYLAENYIQHNPMMKSGRAGVMQFVAERNPKPLPIVAKSKTPFVAILAEGDLVMISFVREYPEPADASKKYTTTWFDMFRVKDGKIVEHWDGVQKPVS